MKWFFFLMKNLKKQIGLEDKPNHLFVLFSIIITHYRAFFPPGWPQLHSCPQAAGGCPGRASERESGRGENVNYTRLPWVSLVDSFLAVLSLRMCRHGADNVLTPETLDQDQINTYSLLLFRFYYHTIRRRRLKSDSAVGSFFVLVRKNHERVFFLFSLF